MSSPIDTNQPDHIVHMHEMVTDTNQASEDELKTKAPDSSSEAGNTIIPQLYGYCLEVGLELSNYQAVELTKLTQKLIRTEKLKLLDEVIHQSTINLKSASAVAGWAEIRKKQLEAEL